MHQALFKAFTGTNSFNSRSSLRKNILLCTHFTNGTEA